MKLNSARECSRGLNDQGCKIAGGVRGKRTQEGKAGLPERLRIFEAMWKEAMLLGVLPLKDPLEGIEVDIRIARILNDVRTAH